MLHEKLFLLAFRIDAFIILVNIIDVRDDVFFNLNEKFLEFWFFEFIEIEEKLVGTI